MERFKTQNKNLSKQIHVHSVDTSAFYNLEETVIHNQLNTLYILKKEMKNRNPIGNQEEENLQLKGLNKQILELKESLLLSFQTNRGIRKLREDLFDHKSVISIFESTLTRTLGVETNTVTKDIIIIQAYFLNILEDIILNGFMHNGEKYVFLTASAGQIRTKKNVFIRESVWNRHRDTLMCGLSIEKINAQNGLNTNKYISYSALFNSATEAWEDFDIDRVVVVEDMELPVYGLVDYINNETFEIHRKNMNVPITHTDGCGMILPAISKKNFQFRMPWIKGLLSPFNFLLFAKKHNAYWITDIDGKKHHIADENIQIILTRSQFKTSKYYASWDEYKANFKSLQCEASKCNEEEDVIGDAKLDYQILQTLNDMTDDELTIISERSKSNIYNIGRDRNTMLRVMGVVKSNINKNYFQSALEIYPELLSDTYSKELLKDVKRSLVKKARQGKLEIDGRYTFILPDLYAFCERIFLGYERPQGLLNNGEVFCKLFAADIKLDCLRSPHLYREHAVRVNTIHHESKKWFTTNGLYMSCHDLISKMLQCDWDGDKSPVVSDRTIINAAERHMKEIVPLYYEMKSAKTELISSQSIYNGLRAAYTGGKIGEVSNNISKVWNSKSVNLDVIKWLCMINNYTIDYAKTLYMPTVPKHVTESIKLYTQSRLPHFFLYAKDKDEGKLEAINNSVVNRLEKLIPKVRLNFKAANLGKLDYTMLMSNKKVSLNQDIIDAYTALDLRKRFMTNETIHEEIVSSDKLYVYHQIRNQILAVHADVHVVVDVLVKYLYQQKNSRYKTTLWSSFGDVIVENLRNNIKNNFEDGYMMCEDCGKRELILRQRQSKCADCQEKIKKEKAGLRLDKFKRAGKR